FAGRKPLFSRFVGSDGATLKPSFFSVRRFASRRVAMSQPWYRGPMLDGQFTLGVEEEYQIVDPQTRELRSYISRLLEDGKSVLRERVRMELHQSVVEVGTTVCKNVGEVRTELLEMRGQLNHLA